MGKTTTVEQSATGPWTTPHKALPEANERVLVQTVKGNTLLMIFKDSDGGAPMFWGAGAHPITFVRRWARINL